LTDESYTKSIAGYFGRYFNSSTAPKISVLILMVVATSGFALAAHRKSNPNPCNLSDQDAAGLNGNFSTDIHALRDYTGTIARILKEEKFEELDCLADRATAGEESTMPPVA
jgi:hypothetical protein